MKRKIYSELVNWKKESSSKTALLIDGARRVGKSYIVQEFAQNEYKSYIFIDFNIAPEDVKNLFVNYLNNLDTLFMYLSGYYNVKLYEHESLIIFDEVQLFPRARAAIKYLVADGRYDYIETGSLMSIKKNIKDILIPSEERHLKMYPMDFEEFLWAVGNETLMDIIKNCFDKKKNMGQAMHRKAMDHFRQYLIVGGMPQAVNEYIETHDFDKTDRVKRDILELYRADIVKHAAGYEMKVGGIFDEIPAQLQKHEKKFKLSSINKEARFRDYEDALFWLKDAMIVNICYNSSEPNIGLKLNMDRLTLKCYMADTGLLISHAFDENGIVSEEIYKKLLFDKLEVNKGMIIENI
ncbi:MAG: AAA family ATPase, partial [Ruminiclostridium sp.]|nr:AAA family ATPase [Ruminiclostridium sp.]